MVLYLPVKNPPPTKRNIIISFHNFKEAVVKQCELTWIEFIERDPELAQTGEELGLNATVVRVFSSQSSKSWRNTKDCTDR